jgi:hypothetical protein
MPLPAGTRYRVKSFSSGKKVRLAFGKGGKVLEAKSMKDVLADHARKGSFKKGKATKKR